MSKFPYSLLVVSLALVFYAIGLSSPPAIARLYPYQFGVLSKSKQTGAVRLKFELSRNLRYVTCDSVNVTLEGSPGVTWAGPTSWTISFLTSPSQQQILDITVPVSDTSHIYITIKCDQKIQDVARAYFVTTGDTLEYWVGDPHGYSPNPAPPRTGPRAGDVRAGEFPEDDSLYGLIELSPKTLPSTGGAVEMALRYAPMRHPCDSLFFKILPINGMKVNGPTSWVAPMVGTIPYSSSISLEIPSGDTTGIRVEMICGAAHYSVEQYFVSTGGKLAYFPNCPWGVRWRPHPKPLISKVSERSGTVNPVQLVGDEAAQRAQLRQQYEAIPLTAQFDMLVFIEREGQLDSLRRVVPILTAAGDRNGKRVFKCRIAKSTILRLQDLDFEFDYVTSPLRPVNPLDTNGSTDRHH